MSQREGYLYLDHRASPGLPEDMARRMGALPGSRLTELATLTCCHCKTVVVKNPYRQRERASCPKCSFKYLCDICAAKTREPDYVHMPLEAVIQRERGG